MRVLRQMTLLTLPFFAAASFAQSNDTMQPAAVNGKSAEVAIDKNQLKERFAKIGLNVVDVVPSGVNGLVELQTADGVLYSSPQGDHFIAGTLYSLDKHGRYEDVVAKRQAPLNAEKINAFKDSMIEFKAANEKYVVTVFTDITCGYCVRLHSQMQGYNDLGITVRYLAYPRQGATGMVADQMAAIWCADDQQAAMHDGKVERKFPEKGENFNQCQETIKQHYALGRQLGISGTPAIFLPNGEMVGGYLPPAQLLQRLQQL